MRLPSSIFQHLYCRITNHEWVLSSIELPNKITESLCKCKKCGKITEQFGKFRIDFGPSIHETHGKPESWRQQDQEVGK